MTGKSVHATFGSPDDLKFCASMTLFSQVTSPDAALFQQATDQCCGGNCDPRTPELLGKAAKGDPI
ncbi:MAG: DUF1810 family protein [Rhizobiales bacterium]|nr:DUF1810 family protein [Rhizobacter sp.]